MRPRRHLGGRGLGGRGIGQRSTSAGFSPTTALLAAPATPTVTLTTGATDNTPGFQFDGAIVELDTVRFQYDTHSDFSAPSDITNAIDAAEDAANQLIFSTGTLADGTWYFRARIERPGHANSAWSNTETETIDATAPTLSSPTGTKTGITTASLSVSTNEGNGTLYWVVDTGSTPSATQVKQGKGSGGSAANGDADSQVVSVTGAQTISGGATGLTGSTTYKAYYMHEDAVGNQSTVSASASFTTDSALAFALDFIDHKEDTVDATSTTQAGVSLGAADTNRIIAVCVGWRATNSSDTITSVTIGGVSATQASGALVTYAGGGGALHINSDVWYAAVPTGTTGTVVVNFSATFTRLCFSVYRIITGHPTPSAVTTANQDNGTSPISTTITVPATGGAFAMQSNRFGTAASVNWTNATKDFEVLQLETFATFSSAKISGSGSVAASSTVSSAGSAGVVQVAIAWDI